MTLKSDIDSTKHTHNTHYRPIYLMNLEAKY